MREYAMEAIGVFEAIDDPRDACPHVGAREESALGGGEHRHDAEAGAAGRHRLAIVVAGHGIAALARHAADRMAEIPEIAQRLALHAVEQGVVGQRCHAQRERQTTRFVPSLSELPPISMTNVPGSNTDSGAASVSARTKRRSSAVIRNATCRLSPAASAILRKPLSSRTGRERLATGSPT